MRLRSFYDKDAPIYTMSRFLPPSKVLRHSPSFSAKQETTMSMIPTLACASAAFQSNLTASPCCARAMASAATSCTCTMAPVIAVKGVTWGVPLWPQVLDAEVTNSILGDGCVVRGGTTIKHSVIGLRSLIGENCHIEDALIMGCGMCAGNPQRMPTLGRCRCQQALTSPGHRNSIQRVL